MNQNPKAGGAGFRPHPPTGTLRAEDLHPHSYLLTIERQRCACGTSYTFHRLSLVLVHKEWTASTKFRKLQPCASRTRSDLPVGVSRLQPQAIDVCEACFSDKLTDAPPAISDRQWADALAHEAREAKQAKAKPRPSTKPARPSIDITKLEF